MKILILRFPFSISSRLSRFYRDPRLSARLKSSPSITKFYPKQHPRNLLSSNPSLLDISQKPTKALTPFQEIPDSLFKTMEDEGFEQPKNPRTLFVGIFGTANVGKSSLMNRLMGENVSASSPKAHTTDEKVMGILSNPEKSSQVVLYDTPGLIQKYKGPLSFSTEAWSVMDEIDYALFVIDGSKKRVDDAMRNILNKLNSKVTDMKFFRNTRKKGVDENQSFEEMIKEADSEGNKPQKLAKVLVINKIDKCNNKRDLKWYINELEDLGNFDKVFYTSCETGYGIEQLKAFLEGEALSDEWMYNPKAKSDKNEVEKIEEIFKSLVFERLHYELPFRTGIELKEFVIMSNSTAEIEVHLDVETDIQKKILIGHHGRNVKYIAEKARVELIKLYKKDFKVSVLVKKRSDSLKEMAKHPAYEEVVPKGLPMNEAKDELERTRQERRDSLKKMAKGIKQNGESV